MREMLEHKAYKYLDTLKLDGSYGLKYIHMDYVILESNIPYDSLNTHKQVAVESMKILENREREWLQKVNSSTKVNCKVDYNIDESKMVGTKISTDNFFDEKSEYAKTFLEPVYTNKKLTLEKFNILNNILFPNKNSLEIYDWCDDEYDYWENQWSNYFTYGLDWWGVYFWTIYDESLNTFTTISASTTD